MTSNDNERATARAMAAESLASGDDTGWFERLYSAADNGTVVPWIDGHANPALLSWPDLTVLPRGRACVVGCAYGDDAEFLAAAGFAVSAFDISPTAVEHARQRFPASAIDDRANRRVDYRVDDACAPSPELIGTFDLVVEISTLQVLRGPARKSATAGIASLLAAGGFLLVIARGRDATDPEGSMPWPLLRDEVEAFTAHGLSLMSFEDFMDDEQPPVRRFRAIFRRPN